MRIAILSALATSVLALSACSMEGGETASAASSVAAKASPDFTAAVSSPGREEGDTNLDESRKPVDVLSFMGLETGDSALDIFAGGGYYSEIMGAAVGSGGSVVAVNPPQFVSSDQAKAKWAGISGRQSNVSQYQTQLSDFATEPAKYDFAMMHLIYHDLYFESEQFKMPRMDPDIFLAKLFGGMKPGGIIAVVDHVGGEGETRALVEKTHRINPSDVKADFARAGFVLEAESDMFANPADDLDKNVFDPSVRGKTNRFVMKFRKPG